jgi:hypothetical protein
LALPCDFLSLAELVRSASFNKAAMLSGDELVCVIANQSVSGIAVREDDHTLDRLPGELVTLHIVPECVLRLLDVTVRFPPPVDQDLGLIVQAPVQPRDAVTDLGGRLLGESGKAYRHHHQVDGP